MVLELNNHGASFVVIKKDEQRLKELRHPCIADLHPDMSGIRPKIQGPGAPAQDFVVRHEVDSGFEGLINLIGIESPGLTASLRLHNVLNGTDKH